MKKFALAAVALSLASSALATTIDFTTMTPGPVTTISGVTFSMSGGPNPNTTPVVAGVFGNTPQSLTNSSSNNYPTSAFLTATFSSAASGVSFTFNNYGTGTGSYFQARDGGGNLVSTGSIDLSNDFVTQNFAPGSGIKTLTWSNNSNGNYSWQFGVGELNFTAGDVPEPAAWALMIGGFGVVGAASRRRRMTLAA